MSERGFTLLELLVVLSILGLALTIAVPRITQAISGPRLERLAQDAAIGLRKARSLAVAEGRPIAVTIDTADGRLSGPDESLGLDLPATISLGFETVTGVRVEEGEALLRFFPDGSASGGRLTFKSESRRIGLEVDWLTGRVRLEE